MRKVVQALTGLNAVFQTLFGAICMVAPPTAVSLFKVELASASMTALVRMFGGLLASSGVLSGLIALKPERDAILTKAFGAVLLLNVATDALVLVTGDLRVDQLIAGMVIESAAGLALLAYRPR